MKKITLSNLKASTFLTVLCFTSFAISPAFARQVPQADAKKVAEIFFSKYSTNNVGELAYTSLDNNGKALYYAFNLNNNSGFVIVSAEDAGYPIIGYSTEVAFEKPNVHSSASYWLSKRESEIIYLRENNISPNAAISSKWNQYLTAQSANKTSSSSSFVAPLLSTKWNQSPFYNDSCPGGSVTGCVATTMAQIMKFWSYPLHGTGSSSYCDCTPGFSSNYGTLKANYGAATYNWNAMPLSINGHNSEIAKLMFHCGVSVDMDYTPSESGAMVINAPVCARNSYINYFKYDPNTILGVNRSGYSDSAWMAMIKGDLDIGRPIQYAGYGNAGGHTWVCDGYDQNDFVHMNWGWGGSSNGYFSVNVLNPGGMDFSMGQQAIFGIVPIATESIDAAIISISPTNNGCTNNQYTPTIKIRNYGINTLFTCDINYKLDNGTTQTQAWGGYLVTGQSEDVVLPTLTLGSGQHVLNCTISNPNATTDPNALNDQSSYSFGVYTADNLPIVEGFETPATTTANWDIVSSAGGSDWAFTTQAFSGGAQSLMVNNLTNTPGNISILQGMKSYDFSTAQDPYIHFKVAYQQKALTNNDKLRLETSTDCGATWLQKWTKQGSALATTTVLSSTAFIPSVTDFVEYTVPALFNPSVLFRWVFTADATAPGNNIYIDDINIYDEATVGIKVNSALANNNFEVYPNPANAETFLKFNLTSASSVEINVTDISGRKVIDMPKTQYNSGNQLISINKDASLSKGIYMVTISADGVKSTRKLVIN